MYMMLCGGGPTLRCSANTPLTLPLITQASCRTPIGLMGMEFTGEGGGGGRGKGAAMARLKN